MEKQPEVLQYRWVLILYHAGKEHSRRYGEVWFDDLDDCKEAAESMDFDFCCGYHFEYESRPKDIK